MNKESCLKRFEYSGCVLCNPGVFTSFFTDFDTLSENYKTMTIKGVHFCIFKYLFVNQATCCVIIEVLKKH